MNKPPANEQDLVYALVKIRKSLEHGNQRSTLWTLTFFCDWVLHAELDRAGAKKILDTLDKRLGRFNPARPDQFDPDGMVQKILSLELFREHLLGFLKLNHLPSVWAEDQFAWSKTVMLYGEQVRDTPLVMTRKNYKFRYLQKVVVTACDPDQGIVQANPGERFWGLRCSSHSTMAELFPWDTRQTSPNRLQAGQHKGCSSCDRKGEDSNPCRSD